MARKEYNDRWTAQLTPEAAAIIAEADRRDLEIKCGRVILEALSAEQVRSGYQIDPTDVREVGRQALAWGDINEDGTLN